MYWVWVSVHLCSDAGHYEQDAKTYANWGVDCEFSQHSPGAPSTHQLFPTAADVKMDWCNTDINGTQLDPKVQYPQMVRTRMHHMVRV